MVKTNVHEFSLLEYRLTFICNKRRRMIRFGIAELHFLWPKIIIALLSFSAAPTWMISSNRMVLRNYLCGIRHFQFSKISSNSANFSRFVHKLFYCLSFLASCRLWSAEAAEEWNFSDETFFPSWPNKHQKPFTGHLNYSEATNALSTTMIKESRQ